MIDIKNSKEIYTALEENVRISAANYKRKKPLDNEKIYRNGRIITIREMNLPFGLLGYTDTNSEIVITTRNDFDIPREKILVHELRHCSLPDDSELNTRYGTELEFDPPPSINFSFYHPPLYKTKDI